MTPDQALAYLSIGTDPRKIGTHTRTDYAVYEQALQVLTEVVKKSQRPALPAGQAGMAPEN